MSAQDSPREGPPLLRPVPRRPFDLSFTGPTPPEDEPPSPPSPSIHPNGHSSQSAPINFDTLNRKLLDPRNNVAAGSESTSISRATSFLNLTGSALLGIYSPTTYGKDRFYNDGDEPNSPWGTGAESPVAGPSARGAGLSDLRKEKSNLLQRRRTSSMYPAQLAAPLSSKEVTFHLLLRALLLFCLGMGYGLLVERFQDRSGKLANAGFQVHMDELPDITKSPRSGWDYGFLAFWGVSGVVLGALLPWFDGIWQTAFGRDDDAAEEGDGTIQGGSTGKRHGGGTDWSLVVRGIGAFAGIVFAIRKLPWDSTLQVSLTLALVNPFLWYLIDRSKPGFVLSAAVGLTGSSILLGLKPEMVPSPAASPIAVNATSADGQNSDQVTLGGLARQETLETGIWMWSVLFCCCVCFGNIGRRLALSKAAVQRGRWVVSK